MADSNIQIRSLHWDKLTTARWDVIYRDCGISLLEGDSSFPVLEGAYEIRMVVLLICLDGTITISSSQSSVTLRAGDALVCMPGTILQPKDASSDLRYKVICLSPDVIARHSAKEGYFTRFSRRKSPFVNIRLDKRMLWLIETYYSILEIKNEDKGRPDCDLIVSNIVGCLLFDLLNRIPQTTSVEAIRHTQGYKYVIFQNFIKMVTADNGTLRSVKEYARRLNISPKYLSVICRDASGKSAGDWVKMILDGEIERLLRYTDLSMKEIAIRLEFTSLSLFSKYVRLHFKMSGVEYRRTLRDETASKMQQASYQNL